LLAIGATFCAAPSQALGVKIGASTHRKPRPSKNSRIAEITAWRIRITAQGRFERSHRWRCSIRKATPCSLGASG
jgi:hypothetical protein